MNAAAKLLQRLTSAKFVPHQSTKLYRIINSAGRDLTGPNELPLSFPSPLLGQLYLAEQANLLPVANEKPRVVSSIIIRGSEFIEGKADRSDIINGSLEYLPTDTLL